MPNVFNFVLKIRRRKRQLARAIIGRNTSNVAHRTRRCKAQIKRHSYNTNSIYKYKLLSEGEFNPPC